MRAMTLAHLAGLTHVRGDDSEYLSGIVAWRCRRPGTQPQVLLVVEVADDAAGDVEGVGIVQRVVVGDPGFARVQIRTAEILGRNHFAGRRLHQRRPAEENRALPAHDDALVAHRRDVGAARGARPHHHRDLGDARGGHVGLVVEDAAEVLAVGEDLVLVREVRPARIDEVHARQPVLSRDLLRAKLLLHRDRVVGAALHRRVVAHHHALDAGDAADAGDEARGRHLAAVHAVGGEQADLEERRARVEEPAHPFAGQELPPIEMAGTGVRGPALHDFGRGRGSFLDETLHPFLIGPEGIGSNRERGIEDGHREAVNWP